MEKLPEKSRKKKIKSTCKRIGSQNVLNQLLVILLKEYASASSKGSPKAVTIFRCITTCSTRLIV